MADALWDKAKQVFIEAAEKPSGDRAEIIRAACGDDDELRGRVEALLQFHDQADELLVTGGPHKEHGPRAGSTETARPAETLGAQIGPYKLLQQIGEGGFGAVYMAEQTEPVVRKVALKIIKLGMDTKQALARFDAERQALALMDHPNIARVLDAGATDSGRPYFVMELVKGVSITAYCDTERLNMPDRLDLFVRVCNAVQHAHQKGIIHRDIKPSNVMITLHDGKPVPKVIDFGIAKATSARLTEKTLFTEYGQLIGTPAYMSPEQAEMSGLDIDTRSDIYSLGVLLYELLTGLTPFDAASLRDAGYEGMRRIIREDEPPKPSTRVSTLRVQESPAPEEPPTSVGADLRLQNASDARGSSYFDAPVPHSPLPVPSSRSSAIDIARFRRTDPAALTRSLRGDLDWIVMKCLDKDRQRRYETANGLASDIQRHLNNEPVLASPPSRIYRFRKFARRNKVAFATGGAVAASLVIGLVLALTGFIQASHERDRAREATELAEKRAGELDQRANDLKQVADFQSKALSQIDVEAMGRGIKERFREQVRASLARQWVGEYPNHRPRTEEEIEAELAAFDELAGAAQAVDIARGIMDEYVLKPASDELVEQFADQPLVRAQLHGAIGTIYASLGLYSEEVAHSRRALEILTRELGEEHEDVATALNNLSVGLDHKGDHAAAEPLFREALALIRKLHGDEHPDVASTMGNLANTLLQRGDHVAAEPLCREALAMRRKLLGNEHPHVAASLIDLANLLRYKGDLGAAELLSREALAMRRKLLGEEHPDTLSAGDVLAGLLQRRGSLEESETLRRQQVEVARRSLGDDHPKTLSFVNNHATALQGLGRDEEALSRFRETLESHRRLFGDNHPDTITSGFNVGFVARKLGLLDEAEARFREALDRSTSVFGDEHQSTVTFAADLSDLLRETGRLQEAESVGRRAVSAARAALPRLHLARRRALLRYGRVLTKLGRFAEAEPDLLEAWECYRDSKSFAESQARAMVWLAELYDAWHAAEPHAGYDDKAAEWRAKVQPLDMAKYLRGRGLALERQGSHAEAEPLLRECLKIRKEVLARDDWLIFSAMNVLGAALAGQGKFAEAEPLLIEGGEKMIPPQKWAILKPQALERIIKAYEAWHAAEPGQGYDARAAEWREKLDALTAKPEQP